MNKKIIIIEGFLASGKSTFAELLAKSLSVPCFIKDQMKIALCKSVSVTNREESSRFSAVTFDAMLYSAERLMEAGIPVILEGNFVPAGVKKVDEAGVIKALVDRYSYQSLTFHFTGDTEVLHGRFVERENQPQRGDVNRMGFTPTPEHFAQWCENLSGFHIGGEVVVVDTTDFTAVDFQKHLLRARQFVFGEV